MIIWKDAGFCSPFALPGSEFLLNSKRGVDFSFCWWERVGRHSLIVWLLSRRVNSFWIRCVELTSRFADESALEETRWLFDLCRVAWILVEFNESRNSSRIDIVWWEMSVKLYTNNFLEVVNLKQNYRCASLMHGCKLMVKIEIFVERKFTMKVIGNSELMKNSEWWMMSKIVTNFGDLHFRWFYWINSVESFCCVSSSKNSVQCTELIVWLFCE